MTADEALRPPAILILGAGSLEMARRVQGALPGSQVLGLAGRAPGSDALFTEFGAAIRELFQQDTPIIAFCAAGIVIRSLAPLLQNKRAEPPVLALAEDGSAVVPLLGGLRGVNTLARRIGAALGVVPAITTTGELRFGLALEHPPAGYVLQNPEAAKRFMADLLGGKAVRLQGSAPWLAASRLPLAAEAPLTITVTARSHAPAADELVYHPRVLAVSVAAPVAAAEIESVLTKADRVGQSVACLIAPAALTADNGLRDAARRLGCPLRIADDPGLPGDWLIVQTNGAIAIAEAPAPIDPTEIGRAPGRLTVVGLGPGAAEWMTPAARQALNDATDIVGYETYVQMAGPFRKDQIIHASDNREELARAQQAFALAATGRNVAVVSSGDPGVFAMAAAVMEALEQASDPSWAGVELAIIPGISAAQAAAARAGAPLGHDFCVISLSDNLKPWPIIRQRLEHAAAADLVIALYNPLSQARPHQFGEALTLLRQHRAPETPVVLGRDVGRPGETMRNTTLGALQPADVDMRTVVLIGSSATRRFASGGSVWTYAPRRYP